MKAHKYFSFGALICMIMAIWSGHKLISPKKKHQQEDKKS